MSKVLLILGILIGHIVLTLNFSTKLYRREDCILPPHPSSGQWSAVNFDAQLYPGQRVPKYTILEIHCNVTHKLEGSSYTFCVNGRWKPHPGRCLKTCPSLYSTATVRITCNNSCTRPIEGTVAQFKCASFYEEARVDRPKAFCINGEWSEKIPDCVPICGRTSMKKSPTLIVNGEVGKMGDFPWQVAIYTVIDESLICGGTLLSERVVLTAAHCITDEEGNLLPKENYKIVVGKYYRKYEHPFEKNHVQYSSVHAMFVPDHYYGMLQNYVGDIGVIVTEKTFRFSVTVQPVCVDWSKRYQNVITSEEEKQGYVSGWGYIHETGHQANEIRKLTVPFVSRRKCEQHIVNDYLQYLTYDKICAGYIKKGKNVCNGDSGGGLVFKQEGRYYIAGIVSIAPLANSEEGGCDSQQYALYTFVYNYIDTFILEKLIRFRSVISY